MISKPVQIVMCLLEISSSFSSVVCWIALYIKYFLHLKKKWLLNGVDSFNVGEEAQQTCFQGPSEVIHSIKSIVSPNQHVELQDFVSGRKNHHYVIQSNTESSLSCIPFNH